MSGRRRTSSSAPPSAATADLPDIATPLVAWQRQHGRHTLPWQRSRDPYRVWLSEIMLQQTQVSTVLGYYERFLQRCPTVADLAAASEDEVLALWSGLGYYSRARNLHRCAQAVVAQHGGQFPRSSTELATLPGIGRSTAAAIAAFCFGERCAILDGNVKRVLGRVLAFDGDLAATGPQRALWALAEQLVPANGVEAYTQGLMDLGATLCSQRAPQCDACPLRPLCRGAASGEPQRWPVKTRKLKRSRRENGWLWLQCGDAVWLQQRPASGVWAGLWSLPEWPSREAIERQAQHERWPGEGLALPGFTHVLTHLDWWLEPLRWTLPAGCVDSAQAAHPATHPTSRLTAADREGWRHLQAALPPGGRWWPLADALGLGLPAPVRRLLGATPG